MLLSPDSRGAASQQREVRSVRCERSALTPRPPLPILGEGEQLDSYLTCSPSPRIGRGGRGVRAMRPPIMSRNGMVTSAHYLASMAGVRVLMDGGNAVDAAVAVAATLN